LVGHRPPAVNRYVPNLLHSAPHYHIKLNFTLNHALAQSVTRIYNS
jgi:hypothetical protein